VRDEPLARLAWRAISHPRAFFARLDDRPQLALALAVMAVSALAGSLIVALLALRATGSDAWAPALLGVPVAALVYLAVVTLLGGLTLMRPAGLDLRAFEIVAWAWVPTGALAASLLPIGLFAPWPTLLGGTLALLPAWHLWMIWRGLEVHAVRGRRAAFLFYVLAVFALPTVLTLFTATVLSTLA
jgi:hypothetical protein